MYKIDDEKTYYMLLPPNMQDTDAECFSYAISHQMQKFMKKAEKLNVWGNLDGLDPKYYDLAAACMNAQYYRSNLPDNMKLKMIKHAYEMHRYAGTQTAIDALLNIVFNHAEFTPWTEYEGKPYRFKVLVYDMLTENTAELFTNVLQKVKAARSILDAIDIGREIETTAYYAMTQEAETTNPDIREDNSGENTVKQWICTGATENKDMGAPNIKEYWDGKNETRGTENVAAMQTRFFGAEDIRENNNLEAETIKMEAYAGMKILTEQKNADI